jgi:hypothetical protein
MKKIRVQPESLSRFGQAARSQQSVANKPGLFADAETAPDFVDSEQKDDAATRVLREGATGKDHGADEAIHALPDRVTKK